MGEETLKDADVEARKMISEAMQHLDEEELTMLSDTLRITEFVGRQREPLMPHSTRFH
jgi:hypothetical protein